MAWRSVTQTQWTDSRVTTWMVGNKGPALTWGLMDHFVASSTYLQFPIRVCYSATLLELVFPGSLSAKRGTFSYDHELSPVTDLWTWPAYDQISESVDSRRAASMPNIYSKVIEFKIIVWTHKHTHTVNRLHYLDHKLVGNSKITIASNWCFL